MTGYPRNIDSSRHLTTGVSELLTTDLQCFQARWLSSDYRVSGQTKPDACFLPGLAPPFQKEGQT